MPVANVSPSRTSASLFLAAGLAVAGCTSAPGPGDDQATSTPDPTASGSPTPVASPSDELEATSDPTPVTPTVDTPDLDAQCTVEPDAGDVATIRYAVPSAWKVEDRCDVLDPDKEELPEQTEVVAAIFVNTSQAPYTEVNEESPASTDLTTWLGARAGYQAARTTSVSTGEALSPEGQPNTTWSFDLDAGTDDQGGVFTLMTGGVDGDAYDLAQATVDAIAQTVVLQPAAGDMPTGAGSDIAVVRTEGGGAPYTVTYDGDCFALRPGGPTDEPTDELCELDPTAGPLVAGVLGGDVVVGYAPATSIAVEGTDVPPPYGLVANIEGGTVFAFRAAQLPSELTAVGPGGEELLTVPAP
jgi:hypothetical protein